MQTPRFRVRDWEDGGSDSGGLLFETSSGMTAGMESLVIPLGGFSVQQAIHAPLLVGMAHQDLRQVPLYKHSISFAC